MFKTKPEHIKLRTITNMKLLPDPGEQFDYRGGRGNKILKQIKNEDGVIYERLNPNEEWEKFDLWTMYKKIKQGLGIKSLILLKGEDI